MYQQQRIDYVKALRILKGFVEDEKIIAHSHAVYFAAMDDALKCNMVGISCNPEEVSIGGLLHDIGKEWRIEKNPKKGMILDSPINITNLNKKIKRIVSDPTTIGLYDEPDIHPIISGEILQALRLPQYADMARTHGFAEEVRKTYGINGDFLPRSIEQKIVANADFRVINTNFTSVDQRISCLEKRYQERKSWEKLENLQNAIPRMKALEEELMRLWSKNYYLRMYVDDVREFVENQE